MAETADDVKDLLIRVDAQTELLRQGLSRATKDLESFQKSANDNLQKTDTAFKALGNSTEFNRTQMLQLTHVGKSLFDQIAAGQSPIRALTVEGGRLASIVQGSGGLTGAMSGLVTLIGGPFVAGLLASAVAAAAVTVALARGQSEVAKFENKLKITGNEAGLTRDRFDELSAGIAKAGDTSKSRAEEIANALIDMGGLTREQLLLVGTEVVQFAALTGKSTDDIIKDFAEAQKAPAEYAAKMATSYNLLTPVQVSHIRLLEQQGNKVEALRELYDDLGKSIGERLPASMGYVEKLFDRLKNGASNLANAILDVGKPLTNLEKLADANTRLAALQKGASTTDPNSAAGQSYVQRINAQLAIVNSIKDQIDAENRAADASAKHRREIVAGVQASEDLAKNFKTVGDNAQAAAAEIKRFKDDLAAALRANPNDPVALDRRAHQEQIIADIRKKYSKDSLEADRKREEAMKKYLAQFQSLAGFVKNISDHLPDLGKDLDFSLDGEKLKPLVDLLEKLDPYQRKLDDIVAGIDNTKDAQFQIANRDRPGQQYRQSLNDVNELQDSVDRIKIDGLESLNSELADAFTGVHSLGEAFHNIAGQIINDIARIAIQQAIVKPLANALFGNVVTGATGGGGGGILSSLFGSRKREGGGPVNANEAYIVGEKRPELFVPRVPGVIMPRVPYGGGGAQQVNVHVTSEPSPLLLTGVAVTTRQVSAQTTADAFSRARRPSLPRSLGAS